MISKTDSENIQSMYYRNWFFPAIAILFLSFSFPQNSLCVLKIEIANAKNDDGSIKLALFNSQDGFPKDGEKAYRSASVPLKDKKAVVEFSDLPAGEYAVAVMHDMNNNNKMDFHFYGAPKEGYGASNDASGTFGPPSFDDAKFKISGPKESIVINLKYF